MLALRRIVALLLLFVMMFCIVKNSVLCTFYYLNTDAFISFFCENIDQPALKCNGKCQLAKIAKEERKAQAEKVLSNLQKEVTLFYACSNSVDGMDLYPNEGFRVLVSSIYPDNYDYLYFFRNDKPPQFLS